MDNLTGHDERIRALEVITEWMRSEHLVTRSRLHRVEEEKIMIPGHRRMKDVSGRRLDLAIIGTLTTNYFPLHRLEAIPSPRKSSFFTQLLYRALSGLYHPGKFRADLVREVMIKEKVTVKNELRQQDEIVERDVIYNEFALQCSVVPEKSPPFSGMFETRLERMGLSPKCS